MPQPRTFLISFRTSFAEKELSSGTVVVTVSFHGVPVHIEHEDICSKAECPIAPGEFTLRNTEVLPGITPPVSLKHLLEVNGHIAEWSAYGRGIVFYISCLTNCSILQIKTCPYDVMIREGLSCYLLKSDCSLGDIWKLEVRHVVSIH